jgi:hypothetical protein
VGTLKRRLWVGIWCSYLMLNMSLNVRFNSKHTTWWSHKPKVKSLYIYILRDGKVITHLCIVISYPYSKSWCFPKYKSFWTLDNFGSNQNGWVIYMP